MAATPEPNMFDMEDLQELELEFDHEHMRKEYAPSRQEKIKSFTVACLIINRSVGSGIFATPAKVIQGTNSIGVSLLFWTLGGLLALCGTLVWIEFGLSIPREHVDGKERAVPRSGGEKNYLEWVMRKPKFLATCMFGIVFIILANLSGNAIAFGRYVLWASGKDDDKGPTIAIGIAALTVIPLLHAFSRRGGLFVNNIFAVVKIGILLSIIILGFIVRGGKNLQEEQGHQRPKGSSFHPDDTFGQAFGNIANYTSAFLLVMFTYSGFEQPFYVLSEVDRPRRYFPRAVISTLIALLAIFVLVNIAYVCVIPREAIMNAPRDVDIVEMFFKEIFGEDSKSVRVMNAFVAISILGNLIVMTFTAAKVKQEIAKEGILPMSLFFATGKPTPTAKLLSRWQNWRRHGKKARGHGHGIGDVEHADGKEHLEQSPMAALLLHWLSSLVLIAVTAKLEPVDSYDFLVSLYAYVIIGVMGFFTSFGLLYAKYVRRDFVSQYKVLAGPTACLLYCISNGFFLITAFLKVPKPESSPTGDSSGYYIPSTYNTTSERGPPKDKAIPNFVVPTIGMSTVVWGVIWWLGLHLVMRQRGQRLVVTRHAYCDKSDEQGEWVLKYEIIDHVWKAESEGGSMVTMNRTESRGGSFCAAPVLHNEK